MSDNLNNPAQYNPALQGRASDPRSEAARQEQLRINAQNLHAQTQQSQVRQPQQAQPQAAQFNDAYLGVNADYLHGQADNRGLEFLSLDRGAHEYAQAEKHSNKVRFLKVALPAIAVLIILGISAALIFNAFTSTDAEVSSVSLNDGFLVMENPQLNGFDKNNRAYSLTADRAVQDVENPTRIELENISAELPVDDNISAKIQAGTGVYDAQLKTVTLDNQIEVKTTNGLSLILDDADIDIENGTLKTTGAVVATSPQADISAQSVSVSDNANRVIFSGNVRMTLRPKELQKATQE